MSYKSCLIGLLLFFMCLCSEPGLAYSVLGPDRVTLEAWKYQFYRDPYYGYDTNNGGEQWAYGAGLNLDFHLIEFENFAIYSRNWFHMAATDSQVREAGWEWDQGVRLMNKVEVFYGHHSQHLLDAPSPTNSKYPVYDEYGVRLIIYEKGKK